MFVNFASFFPAYPSYSTFSLKNDHMRKQTQLFWPYVRAAQQIIVCKCDSPIQRHQKAIPALVVLGSNYSCEQMRYFAGVLMSSKTPAVHRTGAGTKREVRTFLSECQILCERSEMLLVKWLDDVDSLSLRETASARQLFQSCCHDMTSFG